MPRRFFPRFRAWKPCFHPWLLAGFLAVWFGIGGAYWINRALPTMLFEWRTFAPLPDDLAKRDFSLPGWAECVRTVRAKVPAGADMLFQSGAGDERYAYLSYLLNYEVYPIRHIRRTPSPGRPRFILVYPRYRLRAPRSYRLVHQGRLVQLWERRD